MGLTLIGLAAVIGLRFYRPVFHLLMCVMERGGRFARIEAIFRGGFFSRSRRPHCVGAYELCRLGRFLRVRGDLSVGDYLGGSSSLSREYFWDPLVISLLNTPTQTAGASLLSPIIREIFLPGSSACHPLLAPDGLSSALVDPGLDYLSRHGGVFHFHSRLLGFSDDGGRVTCLHFNNKDVPISHDDGIILCLPPHIISSFFPDMDVPRGGNVILNVHLSLYGSRVSIYR